MTALTIPNPIDTPELYDTLKAKYKGKVYTWPTVEHYGLVEWSSFTDKAKLDQKGKSGAAKARVSKTGGENVKGTITIHVTLVEPDALPAAAALLDVFRAGAGPFTILDNPLAALAGVRGFMVESVEAKSPHETPGEMQFVLGYVQVDPDAQAGVGGNVSKTPKKQSDLQKAEDEWLARARQAQAYTENQRQNERAALEARAKEAGVPVAGRKPTKFHSVFVDDEDIGTNTKTPKTPDTKGSPAGAAAGSTGL